MSTHVRTCTQMVIGACENNPNVYRLVSELTKYDVATQWNTIQQKTKQLLIHATWTNLKTIMLSVKVRCKTKQNTFGLIPFL